MITTGSPDASLLATCGSDPNDLTLPFGGRQGTRLKMSVADLATSFTLSIALSVRLFGWDGVPGSTAATLPCSGFPVAGAPGLTTLSDFAPSALGFSDFALSDNAACWAACARAGVTGVDNTINNTAVTASEAATQKGRRELL